MFLFDKCLIFFLLFVIKRRFLDDVCNNSWIKFNIFFVCNELVECILINYKDFIFVENSDVIYWFFFKRLINKYVM